MLTITIMWIVIDFNNIAPGRNQKSGSLGRRILGFSCTPMGIVSGKEGA